MEPTKDKHQVEKELIAHIRESLVEHKDPYELGAWEKFNKPKKSRKKVFWLPFLASAAALILLGFATLLIIEDDNIDQKKAKTEITKAKKKAKHHTNPIGESITANDHPDVIPTAQLPVKKVIVKRSGKSKVVNAEMTTYETIQTPQKIANSYPTEKVDIDASTTILKIDEPEFAIVKTVDKKRNILEFLENETKLSTAKNSKEVVENKKDRFTIGLVVAPSFGNVKKLNMGYGLSIDYNLSNKFSLNTGLAYNQMGASSAVAAIEAAPVVSALAKSSNTKSLVAVEEAVTGIDIPLELKYHINSNFYANAGLSLFAVTRQRRSNTYNEEKIVQQSSSLNGANTYSVMLVTERTTEKATLTAAEDYAYLGFYNFAFGYKKKISKNNSFAVEPFLKLPMQDIKMESLKLIGTGVKLKFDF